MKRVSRKKRKNQDMEKVREPETYGRILVTLQREEIEFKGSGGTRGVGVVVYYIYTPPLINRRSMEEGGMGESKKKGGKVKVAVKG